MFSQGQRWCRATIMQEAGMNEMKRKVDLKAMVESEFARCKPVSQEGCCDVAARVDVQAHGVPASDAEIFLRAGAMVDGLFGDAWVKADGAQKSTWLDMCETALRRASNLSV